MLIYIREWSNKPDIFTHVVSWSCKNKEEDSRRGGIGRGGEGEEKEISINLKTA